MCVCVLPTRWGVGSKWARYFMTALFTLAVVSISTTIMFIAIEAWSDQGVWSSVCRWLPLAFGCRKTARMWSLRNESARSKAFKHRFWHFGTTIEPDWKRWRHALACGYFRIMCTPHVVAKRIGKKSRARMAIVSVFCSRFWVCACICRMGVREHGNEHNCEKYTIYRCPRVWMIACRLCNTVHVLFPFRFTYALNYFIGVYRRVFCDDMNFCLRPYKRSQSIFVLNIR